MAETQLFSNFFESTTVGTTTAAATSIQVTDGTGASTPATDEYELFVLDNGTNREIVKCTNRTLNFLTVVRAQEGTTGIAFDPGTKIYGANTAATLAKVNGKLESIPIAASNETNDLSIGTAKATFRVPYAFTPTEVRASLTTAATGAIFTVDINKNGTTILDTKLTIDVTEKTSVTAITASVITASTTFADDDEITIDIDQVGSTIPGAGLKVNILGYRE